MNIVTNAHQIKKLVREAEALSDEAIIAFAKLKQAMLQARQHPDIPVASGQRAIMHLSEVEKMAVSMSTNLLRVHGELSKLAVEHAGLEDDLPTVVPPLADISAPQAAIQPAP